MIKIKLFAKNEMEFNLSMADEDIIYDLCARFERLNNHEVNSREGD